MVKKSFKSKQIAANNAKATLVRMNSSENLKNLQKVSRKDSKSLRIPDFTEIVDPPEAGIGRISISSPQGELLRIPRPSSR